MPILDLCVGDVVRVERAFSSSDESLQVLLQSGTVGVVESIDTDGDALVRFPTLCGMRCTARWVVRKSFGNMAQRSREGHKAATLLPKTPSSLKP